MFTPTCAFGYKLGRRYTALVYSTKNSGDHDDGRVTVALRVARRVGIDLDAVGGEEGGTIEFHRRHWMSNFTMTPHVSVVTRV